MKLPNINIRFSGRFKLVAKKSNGTERVLVDWFDNLITDNGLNLITTLESTNNNWSSTNGIMGGVAVGSGSTAPSVGDTQLNSIIAFTTTQISTNTTINQTDRYLSVVKEYQFGEGVAAGNISEIGVGPSQNNLWSRALILDSSGNPTTITVLSNEFLQVTYEIRCHQPTGDFLSTVDAHDIVLRSASSNTNNVNIGWSGSRIILSPGTGEVSSASNNTIQAITSDPGGLVGANSGQNDSYVPGSFTRTASFFFNTSTANITINSFVFKFGPGRFQFSVDPPIVKNNTDELTVGVRLTWARDGELPS